MSGRAVPFIAGLVLAGAIAGLAVAEPEPAALSGRVEVVRDGDTILLGPEGRRVPVRLWGIDAPEHAQQCLNAAGRPYACGQAASMRLYEMIAADRDVSCAPRDRDRYGRVVAVCRNSQGDLGARMVASGWALDYRQYSRGAYAAEEGGAVRAGIGVWQGEFNSPSDWRRMNR